MDLYLGYSFFFFNDTATTEIYTLSLHDALPICVAGQDASRGNPFPLNAIQEFRVITENYKAEYQKASSAIITATTKSGGDRKSTRLNSSHGYISYAVFCLKKKKTQRL